MQVEDVDDYSDCHLIFISRSILSILYTCAVFMRFYTNKCYTYRYIFSQMNVLKAQGQKKQIKDSTVNNK